MSLLDKGMFDQFSLRGTWWRPGESSDQVPGSLRFSNDGIELQLDRPFHVQELVSAWTPGSFQAPVVFGITTDGTPCSILNVQFIGWSENDEPLLGGNGLLFGRHLENIKESSFRKAVIRFTHLEEWAGQRVHFEKLPSGDLSVSDSNTPEVLLKTEQIPGIKNLSLDSGIQKRHRRTQVKLTRQCRFNVEFDPGVDIGSIAHIMRKLSNLLTLCVGRPVYPISAKLLLANEPNAPSAQDSAIDYLIALRANPIKNRFEPQMIFPFSMLRAHGAEHFLIRWFVEEERLRPVVDLLMSTVYSSSAYVQSTFLSLAQAVESFHRRTKDGLYVSLQDYQNIQQSIIGAIPESTPDALKSKLRGMLEWGNEMSLSARLKQCFEGIDLEISKDLTGQKNVKDFVRLVCDVRNYLTHYKGHKPEIIDSLRDMFNFNQRLRAILVLMIFKYFDVAEARVYLPLKSDLGMVL